MAGLCLGVLCVDIFLRLYRPQPSTQVVRGSSALLTVTDGVPTWEEKPPSWRGSPGDRQHRPCVEAHPDRTRILIFGDSIAYGSSLREPETFSTLLEQRLNTARPNPGFCVLNFSEPGFAFEQRAALARREIPRYRPALVLWQDWMSETAHYVMLGDAAYDVRGYTLREDGYPALPLVPDGLNSWLFEHWRLYNYATLAFANRLPAPRDAFERLARDRMEIARLVADEGGRLALILATPLDKPFQESSSALPKWQTSILDTAHDLGTPAVVLQRELIHEDYAALRLDTCCHFNPRGQSVVASVLEPLVLRWLDQPHEPGQSPMGRGESRK